MSSVGKHPEGSLGLKMSSVVKPPEGFSYTETDCYVKYEFANDRWSEMEEIYEPYLKLHVMSAALHYGQTLFEGLKAFRCRNGEIRVFNMLENLKRLNLGCRRLLMPEVPENIFVSAIFRAINANLRFVPDFGTGASLYVRPLMLGTGPRLGLGPSPGSTFLVLVNPVGNYYGNCPETSGLPGVPALVMDEYDRAAPKGVGHIKVGGNYAADLQPSSETHNKGYKVALYLDAVEHRYIEEFSTSNFVAISKDKSTFVTPKSQSVLSSITNKVLQQLALDMGLKVEQRKVEVTELSDFSEVAACGTATVVTPVTSITKGDEVFSYKVDIFNTLYEQVCAIQNGEAEDIHGWTFVVPPPQTDAY